MGANNRPVARTVHGGGGGVHMSASGTKPRAPQARELRGCGGILPQEILKKTGYLRLHFVRFEDSLLGNKAGRSEGR